MATPCSNDSEYGIPKLEDLGHNIADIGEELLPGGELEALRRLDEHMKNKVIPLYTHLFNLRCSTVRVIDKIPRARRKLNILNSRKRNDADYSVVYLSRDDSFGSCLQEWVCRFEKPQTSPTSLSPSTTILSPYITFGCLSARLFWWKLTEVYQGVSVPVAPPHWDLIFFRLFLKKDFLSSMKSGPAVDILLNISTVCVVEEALRPAGVPAWPAPLERVLLHG